MILIKKIINNYFKLKNIFRQFKYKFYFDHYGKGSKIYGTIKCIGDKIYLGNYSTLNEGVLLNARTNIKIGSFVHISPFVQIHTGSLNLIKNYKKRVHYSKKVIIKDGVWICSGSIILPGVTIEEGSIIAAGSVVNKNVPSFELWEEFLQNI